MAGNLVAAEVISDLDLTGNDADRIAGGTSSGGSRGLL
jgi:hypothetical protein